MTHAHRRGRRPLSPSFTPHDDPVFDALFGDLSRMESALITLEGLIEALSLITQDNPHNRPETLAVSTLAGFLFSEHHAAKAAHAAAMSRLSKEGGR